MLSDSWLASHGNLPVIITMIPVWMMQVAVYQVVKMIAVRNALMRTTWAVYMSLVMSTTLVARRTRFRIRRVHFKNVFVNMVEVCVLQMAVMQIVCMVGVNDGHVATSESMLMDWLLMLGA